MVVMNQYAAIVAHVIQRLFAIEVEVTLSRPDPKFGDFATNVALRLAGTIGKPPRDIAEMIAVELRTNDIFSEVQIAGPGFINLSIAAMNLNNNLDEQCNSEKPFGENNDGQGKTVVVEYPSPNMAKPYSVGHLRSGNQGWAARNLLKATGWQVITDDHLGDYGAPFGTWVVGFKKFSSEQQLAEGGVYELGRVYIETRQAMKEEAERGEHGLAD